MKHFFEKYSYMSVKLLLNQIAIAIFGLVLFGAGQMAKKPALTIAFSAFAIIFYLFLQFTVAYKLGTEDRVSIDLGKARLDPWLPLKIWLLANSVNLILAIFIMLGELFATNAFFAGAHVVCKAIATLFEGMFTGILLNVKIGGAALSRYWITYFVITLPALIVVYISYVVGVKSKKIAKMFEYQYPESDRPEKKSKKK